MEDGPLHCQPSSPRSKKNRVYQRLTLFWEDLA